MPREQVETTIEGTKFRIRQVAMDEEAERAAYMLGRAIPAQNLPAQEFLFVSKILRASCEAGIVDTNGDGRTTWVKLDQCAKELFAGSGGKMWVQWLAWAVEVNFGGFLGGLPGVIQALVTRFASVLQPAEAGSGGASSSTPA